HIVDKLLARGASVRVVDDLSSGLESNIQHHVDADGVGFLRGDLRDPGVADRATRGVDVVVHLAGEHGGRGYVGLQPDDCPANIAGELTLKALHTEQGLKTASCRYFTVYGPRGVENHAVIAMSARAFLRQDPFEVWGTGEQIRNWTYVTDIAEGTIRAVERIE